MFAAEGVKSDAVGHSDHDSVLVDAKTDAGPSPSTPKANG
jgi:hypothetical protein